MTFETINPSTEEVIQLYQEFNEKQIEHCIETAHGAFYKWRKESFPYRAELMLNAANILTTNKEKYARQMALEMGKPLQQGLSEVEKCAWVCRYYAENAEEQLRDVHIQTEAPHSFVTFQPIGIVLAVMPWNFPFWQVFRFAAPNLMAGNAALLKHSRNTMGCAILIEELFKEAGFPDGLFTNLVIGSGKVAGVIKDSRIMAVTITGSTPAGAEVAAFAGIHIKKTVLELGGSDAYVVLEDCDLETTVQTCVTARYINGGQSCIAAKRFIVVDKIKKEFEEKFTKLASTLTFGNPLEGTFNLGPMARKDLQLEIQTQVESSVASGAELLNGGEFPNQTGFFYPPTVLTNVKKGMPAYHAELFGPVAAIISAKDESEAISIANDTSFGLGAAVFTRDTERGLRIAREELQAGCCFVNDFVKSDPRLPFGGIKQSGYGRELSPFGIKEFVNIKTVVGK